MMKKWLALALAALMLAGLLAACDTGGSPASAGGASTPVSTPVSAGGGTEEDPFAEHLTIRWIGHAFGIIDDGTEVQKVMEERFNVTIEPVQIDASNAEQWALYWAEGNTADRIIHWGNISLMYQLVDQGMLRAIDMAQVYELMPTWMGTVEELHGGREAVEAQLYYKGNAYYIPSTNYSQYQPHIIALRSDWMENIGSTSIPATLDEFHDLLLKFVTDDPDGNGADDTWGLDPILDNNGIAYIAGAYGTAPHSYYADDSGKITYTPTTQEWRDVMALLRDWYAEGIIHPEFVTDDRNLQRQKWSEGLTGALPDHPWWFASTTANNLPQQITERDPNATIAYMPAVEGPAGANSNLALKLLAGQGAIFFGANTSDELVERILRLEETLVTDEELYLRTKWGVEGVDYYLDDEGIINLMEGVDTEWQNKKGLLSYYCSVPEGDYWFRRFTPSADMPPYEVSMSNSYVINGLNFISFENTAATERGADVRDVHRAFYYDVITGRRDVDADWDAYLAELDAAGLQEVIAGYEAELAAS